MPDEVILSRLLALNLERGVMVADGTGCASDQGVRLVVGPPVG